MVALLFLNLSTIYAGLGYFDERYLWVVRNFMTQKKSIDDLIEFAVENDINNLLVQVRGRGDALYQSKIVPRSELLKNASFDPLDYVIRKASGHGIKVHAWVNVYLVWSSNKRPAATNHIFNAHPEWVDLKGNEHSFMQKGSGLNGKSYFLAPHHPDVNKHLLTIFRELVALYDIDGLHFDYVRFNDAEYGNNVMAKAVYFQKRQQQGKAIFKDDAKSWNNYRRKAITELVKETKEMLLDVRPECILTAAVKPNLLMAKERYFQEWDGWIGAGYVNRVLPMNYTSMLKGFAENINIMYDNLPKKYRDKIVMGIALYNQEPFDAVDKIYYTEITRFKGISFFSYNVITEKPNYFHQLKRALKY